MVLLRPHTSQKEKDDMRCPIFFGLVLVGLALQKTPIGDTGNVILVSFTMIFFAMDLLELYHKLTK